MAGSTGWKAAAVISGAVFVVSGWGLLDFFRAGPPNAEDRSDPIFGGLEFMALLVYWGATVGFSVLLLAALGMTWVSVAKIRKRGQRAVDIPIPPTAGTGRPNLGTVVYARPKDRP